MSNRMTFIRIGIAKHFNLHYFVDTQRYIEREKSSCAGKRKQNLNCNCTNNRETVMYGVYYPHLIIYLLFFFCVGVSSLLIESPQSVISRWRYKTCNSAPTTKQKEHVIERELVEAGQSFAWPTISVRRCLRNEGKIVAPHLASLYLFFNALLLVLFLFVIIIHSRGFSSCLVDIIEPPKQDRMDRG